MNETEILTPVQKVNETVSVPAEPTPPKPKTCDIGLVLGGTIHDLLKKAPENPVVRAHVMNLIKQEVPKELVSYEAIREWIETTIEPKKNHGKKCHNHQEGTGR